MTFTQFITDPDSISIVLFSGICFVMGFLIQKHTKLVFFKMTVLVILGISVLLVVGSLLYSQEHFAGTAHVLRHGWPHTVYWERLGNMVEGEAFTPGSFFPTGWIRYAFVNLVFYASVVYLFTVLLRRKK